MRRANKSTSRVLDARAGTIAALAVGIGAAAAVIAQGLARLIALVTNVAYFGRVSFTDASPAHHTLGVAAVVIPVLGAVIVGVMARFGSSAIRGHGIPEAMERVLEHESRIPARLLWLKPLSAAVSIGTGGPFGAEGPIIATGGALGSLIGQWIETSARERKTLLAAGAAAGMAATFGSPVSAVFLAIELLLFELAPRSLVPVALASATAAGLRAAWVGSAPVFPMATLAAPGFAALIVYATLGALMGVASIGITRAVYAVEDAFERLPIHWMWWPAIGAVGVGVIGLVAPRVLGVGYDNIGQIVTGDLAGRALMVLCVCKLAAWLIALGSGTSGGTLAPLFTIGGGLGAALGGVIVLVAPRLGVDPRVAGLVGMAALFAGASRALLASIVFAFEATHASSGVLPLLAGCTTAYFVSCRWMDHSIMTTKIARRGVRVPIEYEADAGTLIPVHAALDAGAFALHVDETLAAARERVRGSAHEAFMVLDADQGLAGVIRRSEVMEHPGPLSVTLATLTRANATTVEAHRDLREAMELMARAGTDRLPVVDGDGRLLGVLTQGDVARAMHARGDVSSRRARKVPHGAL